MRALALILPLLCVPGQVRADPLAEAKSAVAQGARLFQAHQYRQALASFEKANSLVPNPRLSFNIGLCEAELGRDAEAAADLDRFLGATESDPRVPEVNRRIAHARLDDLGKALVAVRVAVVPASAALTIDAIPSAPGKHYLRRRVAHTLRAEAPGYAPALAEVRGDVEAPQGVDLVLTPLPRPSPEVQPRPLAESKPSVAPQVLQRSPSVERDAPRNHVPAYLAFGVTALAAGTWAYFGITAASQAGRIPPRCANGVAGVGCSGYPGYHSNATLATVFAGVTAAGGIAGGLLWAFAPVSRGAGAQVAVAARF